MPQYPPGTFGILSGDLSRFTAFAKSLAWLQLPAGSQITWAEGNWVGTSVNKLVRSMRPEDAWFCIMADDHGFQADFVLRLLDHHLPIVAPVVCLRRPPFMPSLFHDRNDGGFRGYTWEELAGKRGVLPVDSFGGPGVIIRREVLDAMGQPFYENLPGPLGREAPHEDLYTFRKCRLAGFQPHVDLDIRIGHCIAGMVTPTYDAAAQRWGINVWSHAPLGTLWPGDVTTEEEPQHAYT